MKKLFLSFLNALIKAGFANRKTFATAWALAKLQGKTEVCFIKAATKNKAQKEFVTRTTSGFYGFRITNDKSVIVNFQDETQQHKSFRLDCLLDAQ